MVRSRGGRDRNGTDAARAEPRVLPSVAAPGPPRGTLRLGELRAVRGEHRAVPWEEEDSTALKWGGEFILILESALAVHCIYVPFSGKKK